jgi:hypothetical protein
VRGRLNIFQAAMLRWRSLYPYNAVHVAELPGALAVPRLREAIGEHLSAFGLSRLTLDEARCRYEYGSGAAAPDVAVIASDGDPDAALAREMERQLNAAFPREGTFEPFRFFAVDAGASFHLGVAYDHFVAGGDSIVALLKGIAGRYEGTAAAIPAPDLYPPAYARLFLRNAGAFYLGQFALPSMILRARRAVRPRYPHGDGAENGFTFLELEPALYEAVLQTARSWRVTLNDMLLAILLSALSPEVERSHAHRRREIAIASVINIRNGLWPGPERTFGQFLSSFLVSHPVPPGIDLRTLAADVHAQTRRVKRRKLYLQTLYAIAFGGLAWRYLTPEQRKHMYAKNYPVWAGMTMLNVEAIWNSAPGSVRVLRYLRAGSTGPFAPLVVTPAAVGNALRIGVSYRKAAFQADEIARIGASFASCARTLCA